MDPTQWFNHFPATIDEGWATLIAAAAGFGIVAYQTRQGFKSIAHSQERQSELDRNARVHQAELDRSADARRRQNEANTLASSLLAELVAASTVVTNSLSIMNIAAAGLGAGGDVVIDKIALSNFLPKFDPLVYKANIGSIGLLGPSTAHDVVSVYNMLLISERVPEASDMRANFASKLMETYRTAFSDWLKDAAHVQKRLLAVNGIEVDPGPVYEIRRARIEERTKTQE
ncbi:hypothetical protein GFB56_05485 [Ensifer sp. T173]|uniref:Uncharacterized protein n=1 Tax=Ensifer canadensis TaxID=555315 RepID=A0AAW4FIC2_9HYPH|nr:hypothetical protein [Ensifer canadensis]MBM3090265.1 hypothetical protein [Ensifer canadensis]UBI75799.1 hypothetical protein J3R84_01160 [Ensifer canadensis]